MHPGSATFFLKDGPQNWVLHPLFNKHLLKASYAPGACSGSRDRNLSTRPGTQSSWVDSQAYHSEIVPEVLWGESTRGLGAGNRLSWHSLGESSRKASLRKQLNPRHYALFKQATFLLASLEVHHAGDILRLKSTKILISFFIYLSPPCISAIQFEVLSIEFDIYPYWVSSCYGWQFWFLIFPSNF